MQCEYFPSSPSSPLPQLPWSEFDHQFQIMFQLGNGKSPTIPEASLSSEGHDFLSHCFEQDPSRRWRANHLLDHPFVKVWIELLLLVKIHVLPARGHQCCACDCSDQTALLDFY